MPEEATTPTTRRLPPFGAGLLKAMPAVLLSIAGTLLFNWYNTRTDPVTVRIDKLESQMTRVLETVDKGATIQSTQGDTILLQGRDIKYFGDRIDKLERQRDEQWSRSHR